MAIKYLIGNVMLMTCPAVAAEPPAATTATAPAGGPFASFGVVITPPPAAEGWKRMLEGGARQIARWAHYGPNGKADAIMTLQLEPAKNATLEQFAAAMAKHYEGTSAKDPTPMGGQPAFRAVGQQKPNVPWEGLVTSSNGYYYAVSVWTDAGKQLPRAALENVAKNLKFIPLAEPSTNTALRGEKFPLFGRLAIEPLDNMRPEPAPPGQGQISVSTFNFRADRPDFIMNVQSMSNPNQATMELLQQRFPGKLNPQAKVPWTKVGTKLPASLSSTFEAQSAEGSQKTRVALALLPDDNQIVMIFFSFVSTDPKAIAAYEKASEKIVESIEPLPQ